MCLERMDARQAAFSRRDELQPLTRHLQQSISDAYATPIAQLAAKYTSVHFVALHHLDAQIDQAGVPALLAYRNGDLFADVMPLAEAVPLSRNTASVLEGVMRERGMLR